MTELYDIFSPSFVQLVSVLSYQKIQNWLLVEFSFNLSKYLKILLPIPLFVLKVSFKDTMPSGRYYRQLQNHKYSTNFSDISVVIPAIVGTILALLVILVLVSSTNIYGFCFNNHFRSHMSLVVDEQESPTKKSKLLLWSFHQAASEFIKITHLHTMLSIRDRRTWSADLLVPTLQPFQRFVYTSFQ